MCAITDAGLAGLVLRFPSTATVNLTCCSNVTVGGVEAVATGCPNLQHLDLSHQLHERDGRRGLGGLRRMPQPLAPQPHQLHERDGRRGQGGGRRMPQSSAHPPHQVQGRDRRRARQSPLGAPTSRPSTSPAARVRLAVLTLDYSRIVGQAEATMY